MPDQPSRSPRQVAIADHLWEAFTLMSRDMGVDRDSLINQALFASARQHGYLSPSATARALEPVAVPDVMPGRASVPQMPRVAENGVAVGSSTNSAQRRTTPPPLAEYADDPSPPTSPLAISASDVSEPDLEPAAPPPPEFFAAPATEAPMAVHEEQEDVPGLDEDEAPQEEEEPQPPAAPAGPVLILYADGREVDRVLGPRFLIGRGKHCDLIINSGKVSREHAAIIREGDEFFMEDLGSSNGTWFDKKRITRRRIEDGDEYFVCSEKITCQLG